MENTLILPVDDELVLRQFSESDASAVFGLIDRNRSHLSKFGDITASKYPTPGSFIMSIVDPSQPSKLRMGIWYGDTFVGSVSLMPDGPLRKELGYYLGSEFQGRGFMGRAVNCMVDYAWNIGTSIVSARVHPRNVRSQNVLDRAGFFLCEYFLQEGFFSMNGLGLMRNSFILVIF